MQELGVLEAVAELQQTQAPKRPRQQRPKVVVPDEEKRRSSRPRAEVDYKETIKLEGRPREPVDYTERLQAIQLDQETAEKLRAELASREPGKQGGKRRGPVDSGKGVRVQVCLKLQHPPAPRSRCMLTPCVHTAAGRARV
jgi:hypothetical protein